MSALISGLAARLKATTGATLVYATGSYAGEAARALSAKVNDTKSLRDWGALCDGVTDDTAKVNAFIGAVGSTPLTLVIPGQVKISGNVTFPPTVEVAFSRQGGFVGTAGTELIQFQSQIIAGPHPVFTNCTARGTNGMTVMPEWFGAAGDGATDDRAAIQAAISFLVNTGGVVQFDARTYNLSANVNIGTASAGSAGQNTMLLGKGPNTTKLQLTGATATGIQVLGAAGTPLQGVSIREMSITKSVAGTGGNGIYLQYTAGAQLANLKVSGYLVGVGYLRATNTIAEKVTVVLSGAANSQHGFDLNGGGTGAGGNASSEFHSCYVDASGVTGTGQLGFYAYGAYVSDLAFIQCETTGCLGWEFDCSASANTGNEDLQLVNCRADMVKSYGVYAYKLGQSGSSDSMLTIMGGWFDSASTGAETDSIFLDTCRGVSIIGAQLYCAQNQAYGTHVKMSNSTNVTITACTFSEMKYGISMTGSGYAMVTANRFYCSSGNAATAFITATGDARSMVNGNVFDGYAAQAVIFDATSSGSGIVNNTANIANITTRFTNNATGGFTANNSGT